MQGLRAFLRREPLLVCWALFALLLAGLAAAATLMRAYPLTRSSQ